jgi:hypothetical protein
MPYTIPDPLKLEFDEQLPVGHYTAYIPWYGSTLTGARVPLNFEVTGHTPTGSMKLFCESPIWSGKPKIQRKRKDGTFTIISTNDGHNVKQISTVYPYHRTVKEQMDYETYQAVEGETIKFPWWF